MIPPIIQYSPDSIGSLYNDPDGLYKNDNEQDDGYRGGLSGGG